MEAGAPGADGGYWPPDTLTLDPSLQTQDAPLLP